MANDAPIVKITRRGTHSSVKPTETLYQNIRIASMMADMPKSNKVAKTAARGKTSLGIEIFFIISAFCMILGPQAETEFVKNVHGTRPV